MDTHTIWQQVQADLKTRMTTATYQANIQHLTVQQVIPANGQVEQQWIVNTGDERTREWLTNRLGVHIRVALSQTLGGPVQVEFVADEIPSPPQGEIEGGRDSSLIDPITDRPSLATPSPLATVDYEQLWNDTGFIKVDHYANVFWRRFLGRAYDLWLYLQARVMTKADLQFGWSPSRKYRFRELAKALRGSVNSIRGAKENCYLLRLSQKLEQPMAECCGKFADCRWEAGQADQPNRCIHWRTGWLEILSAEHLLAVEEIKSQAARSHVLRIQVWRVLPLLTPAQVDTLAETDQEAHDRWLDRYGAKAGINRDQWETERAASLVPLMTAPDYTAGRLLFGKYEPNGPIVSMRIQHCIHEDPTLYP